MRSEGALLIITAVMFILLGIAAILAPLFAGLAISAFIGGLLMAAGFAHIISVLSRDDGGVVLHVALGLVYACAGAYFLSNPALGLIALTLLLAIVLFVEAGIEMVAYSAQRREPGAPWLLVNAFITAALGTLIAMRWPVTAAWAIGTLVGVNLVATGVSRLMLGASVWRSLRDAEDLAREKLAGKRRCFVGERRCEHEVAVAQRLLRLLHEPFRLVVLRARVGVQLAVVDARQRRGGTRQRIARVALRGGVGRRVMPAAARAADPGGGRRGRRGRRRRRRFGHVQARAGAQVAAAPVAARRRQAAPAGVSGCGAVASTGSSTGASTRSGGAGTSSGGPAASFACALAQPLAAAATIPNPKAHVPNRKRILTLRSLSVEGRGTSCRGLLWIRPLPRRRAAGRCGRPGTGQYRSHDPSL
jgi:uncharacterized membrane protein HdeD (DUF308 family)